MKIASTRVLITSAARVHVADEAPADTVPAASVSGGGVWLRVQPLEDPKCVRCWHRRPDVGAHPEHPEICGRCVDNVAGEGERRQFA